MLSLELLTLSHGYPVWDGAMEWLPLKAVPGVMKSTPQGTGCPGLQGAPGMSHQVPDTSAELRDPQESCNHLLGLLKNTKLSTKHKTYKTPALWAGSPLQPGQPTPSSLVGFFSVCGMVFPSCSSERYTQKR